MTDLMDGFMVTRRVRARAGTAVKARANLATTVPGVPVSGFQVVRPLRARAPIAMSARGDLTVGGHAPPKPGVDYALHVSGKNVPSIGWHLGKNWRLHIDADGVPTITGRWKQ
jgi:hypothetical protein